MWISLHTTIHPYFRRVLYRLYVVLVFVVVVDIIVGAGAVNVTIATVVVIAVWSIVGTI